MTQLRWGILGTGNIANQFATGVTTARRSALVAVASRQAANAQAFAAKYAIPTAYGDYDRLLADPTVDAVYNSLPNTMHHEWTLKALAAGKHVLCEKPFAVNLRESEEMFAAAARHNRVLVEAFMYRMHPLTKAVGAAVDSGAIGTLRHIRTSFCYRTTRVAGNIRFDPTLAGGAMMDVGCYCLNFSRLFAKAEPTQVHAVSRLHETGVDDCTSGALLFPNGITATFTCAMTVQADNAAYLCGDEGFIEIPIPWKPPADNAAYTIARSIPPRQDLASQGKQTTVPPTASPRETRHVSTGGLHLYGLEADDFAETVLDGKPRALTPEDTLGNMRLLDEIRRQIGLKF